jgi:hypothetical protein
MLDTPVHDSIISDNISASCMVIIQKLLNILDQWVNYKSNFIVHHVGSLFDILILLAGAEDRPRRRSDAEGTMDYVPLCRHAVLTEPASHEPVSATPGRFKAARRAAWAQAALFENTGEGTKENAEMNMKNMIVALVFTALALVIGYSLGSSDAKADSSDPVKAQSFVGIPPKGSSSGSSGGNPDMGGSSKGTPTEGSGAQGFGTSGSTGSSGSSGSMGGSNAGNSGTTTGTGAGGSMGGASSGGSSGSSGSPGSSGASGQ